MTSTTIGSWRGRTLRVTHAPGRPARLEVSPKTNKTYDVFRAWLRQEWPALTGFLYSLNLAESRPLRAAVAAFVHACNNAERAARWLRFVEWLDADQRVAFLGAAIPYAHLEPPAAVIMTVAPGPEFGVDLSVGFAGVSRGLPEELVVESLLFRQVTRAQLTWEDATADSYFDAGRAFALLAQVSDLSDDVRAGSLWRSMVRAREARRLFAPAFWEPLDADSVCHFLSFVDHELNVGKKDALRWNDVAAIRSLYLTLDSRQQVLARYMPFAFFRHLPEVWPLLARLPEASVCEVDPYHLLAAYARLPARAQQRLAAAPEASFAILAKALSRHRNGMELTAGGLRVLFSAMPSRSVELFHVAPKHLIRLARAAAALQYDHAKAVIRGLRRHELFTVEIADGDIVALDNLLTRHGALARRLRRFAEWDLHFSGRKLMPMQGVALAFTELRAQICLLLAWRVEEEIAANMPHDPHTYAVLRQSNRNRRPLGRFLREPRLDFIDNHPATVAWRRRFPQIDVKRWREGVPFERAGVRLAMERDYREVLKMGTYVGSCLGLGGYNTFNAATVLLDINKQVVFARDAQGNFVARQLLAISEEGKLVCFPVYPGGERARWAPVFAEHAQVLAWALGVAIHTVGDYAIPQVIARDWYDDGSWDLVNEDERVAA